MIDHLINGMTTICFAIIKQNSILIGNVGDSGGYVIENDNLLYTTTPNNKARHIEGLPDDLKRYYRYTEPVVYIGGGRFKEKDFEFKNIKIKPNSKYKIILCSDGVSDFLSESTIVQIANGSETPAKSLVESVIGHTFYLRDELENLSRNERERILSKFDDFLYSSKEEAGFSDITAVVADIPKRRK